MNAAATDAQRPARPRRVDEDATHALGRHGEKVRPALPLHPARTHQPQIRLMDELGRLERVIAAFPAGAVHSMAFSPEGHTLAVGSADGVAKFWNIRALREVATLKAHGTVVSSLAFAPDGRTLATVSADETMRLWRAPGFAEIDR